MLATIKFFGLMFLISASLTSGATILIHRFTDAPSWVMWVSMPFVMFVCCAIGLYISDWWLVVRVAKKSAESRESDARSDHAK